MSKVLLINGSPHAHGCTFTALSVVAGVLEQNGIETEIVHVGHKDIRGCIGCGKCRALGKCVFVDDLVNEVAGKLTYGSFCRMEHRLNTDSHGCFEQFKHFRP